MAEIENVWVRALEMKSSRLIKSLDPEPAVDGEEQLPERKAFDPIEDGADH